MNVNDLNVVRLGSHAADCERVIAHNRALAKKLERLCEHVIKVWRKDGSRNPVVEKQVS
jgi:hypothetical protein